MNTEATQPEETYADGEKVNVIYLERLHPGIIKGEPFQNKHLITAYQVHIAEHGIVPRVHYLIKKIAP